MAMVKLLQRAHDDLAALMRRYVMRLVCLLLLAVQWNGPPLRCMATAKASSRTATPLKPSPLLTRTRAGQSDWKLRLQGVSLDTVVTTNTSCVVVAALVLHSGKTEYGVDVPVASDVGERGGSLPLQCGGADGDSVCGLIDSGASHVYGPLSARLAVHRYLASYADACYDSAARLYVCTYRLHVSATASMPRCVPQAGPWFRAHLASLFLCERSGGGRLVYVLSSAELEVQRRCWLGRVV